MTGKMVWKVWQFLTVRDLDFPFLRRKEKAFVGKKRRSFKNSIGKHESSDTAVANNQRVKNKTINIFPSTLLKKRKLSPSFSLLIYLGHRTPMWLVVWFFKLVRNVRMSGIIPRSPLLGDDVAHFLVYIFVTLAASARGSNRRCLPASTIFLFLRSALSSPFSVKSDLPTQTKTHGYPLTSHRDDHTTKCAHPHSSLRLFIIPTMKPINGWMTLAQLLDQDNIWHSLIHPSNTYGGCVIIAVLQPWSISPIDEWCFSITKNQQSSWSNQTQGHTKVWYW
jgi:hypothetical protein